MLSNLTGELSSIPKHLLYRTCILPIAFQLSCFKGASLYQPIEELKKMQKRMVLQIMEAFYTSLSWKVETISGLILDHFHLDKLIGHHYLRVAFLSKQHILNSLLNIHHSKQADPHCMAISCLTPKQYLKIKSPTVDTNNCLNQVLLAFNSLNKELSLGFCLIDNFPNCFSFHTVDCKDCCGNHLSERQMITQAVNLLVGYQVGNSQENSTRSLSLISILFIQICPGLCYHYLNLPYSPCVIAQGCGQTLGLGLVDRNRTVVNY